MAFPGVPTSPYPLKAPVCYCVIDEKTGLRVWGICGFGRCIRVEGISLRGRGRMSWLMMSASSLVRAGVPLASSRRLFEHPSTYFRTKT